MFMLQTVSPVGRILALNALIWATLSTRATLADAAEKLESREIGASSAALNAEGANEALRGEQVIVPAGLQQVAEAEEIVVTGRASKLYRIGETTSGKLPTAPLASSQTIAVITRELIDDQGARDAQDLYRNISGVSVFSYAGVTARGFRQEENFYDGLRGDPYAGFSVPQLFNVERIEVLKGPAGMLYGQTAPGGLFNYVSKKPSYNRDISTTVTIGSADRIGAEAEAIGTLSETVAGRAGIFYEARDTFRFNADSEIAIADAGATFDTGPFSTTIQFTHVDQNLGGNRLRGVPVDDDGRFLTDRRWNHNEDSDFLDLASTFVQARIEGEIVDGVTFDLAARYNDGAETQQYHEPSGLLDTDGDGVFDASQREFRDQKRAFETWSFGGNGIWSATWGAADNRVLFGFDHYTADLVFDYRRARGTSIATPGLPTPINLSDPAYGQTNPASYNLQVINDGVVTGQRQTGFYALDEISWGEVILIAGARRDEFSDIQAGTPTKGDAWTWRTGLVYRPRADVSLFAQYATSFEPQSASSQDPRAGGPFAPTEGDIVEGGIKTALSNDRIQSSLSIYRIRRTNLLQSDPRGDTDNDGIDNLLAFGEVTSKGVDVDVAADLTPDWVLTLAYGYNDTKITKDNGGGGISNRVGTRFANAPKHQLGFWTRYQIPALNLAAAFGGDYVGSRISLDGQPVRSYMAFDASVMWGIGDWNLLLRIDNIFDKTYAASGFIARTGHFPGEPRSAFLEIARTF
ncbi:MAG: TonB-dependent siderophore receptor [Rhodobacteraceae bacterium]|nr:TonB-dependent siderophore receptor [Paracoccaceae bacterium]